MRAVFGPSSVRRTFNRKSMKSRATHIYCARSRRTINLPLATGQVCYAARGIHKRRVFAGELLVDNYVRRHLRSRLQRILLRVTLDAVPCVNGAHPCEQILRGPLADHIVQCVLHDDHF